MIELLNLLLEPKVLFTFGPLGVVAGVEAWALYYLHKRHEALHTDYLNKVIALKDEYVHLADHLENTLDTLIKLLGERKGERGEDPGRRNTPGRSKGRRSNQRRK